MTANLTIQTRKLHAQDVGNGSFIRDMAIHALLNANREIAFIAQFADYNTKHRAEVRCFFYAQNEKGGVGDRVFSAALSGRGAAARAGMADGVRDRAVHSVRPVFNRLAEGSLNIKGRFRAFLFICRRALNGI